jgi:CheY-like chemotaxis protein
MRTADEKLCSINGTVLVVDDEDLIRFSVRAFLEQRGLSVVDTTSPTEAIRIAEELGDNLALLVTDVVMPGMLGTELARLLKANHPNLDIIFMSGYAAGGTGYAEFPSSKLLQKPFSRKLLFEAVRHVCAPRSSAG